MIRRVFQTAALAAVLVLASGCDALMSLTSDTTPAVNTPASTDTTVSLAVSGLAGGSQTYAWIGEFGTDEWDFSTRTFSVGPTGAGTAPATKLVGTGASKLLEFSFVVAGTWDVPWYAAGQFGIDDNRFESLSNFAVSVPLDKKAHTIEINYAGNNFPQVTIDGGYAANITYGIANRPNSVVALDAAGLSRTNVFTSDTTHLLTWTREYGYQAGGQAAYNSTGTGYPLYYRAQPVQSKWTFDQNGYLTSVTDTLPAASVAGLYTATPRMWAPGSFRDLASWNDAQKSAPGYYKRPGVISTSSPLLIPASAVALDDNLFDQVFDASGPTAIDFSAATGLTTIGGAAFANFPSLTSVTLPSTVDAIGDNAFADDTGITSLTLGSNTVTIGGAAFAGLTSLTAIDIPDSVTFIDDNAFSGDTQVTALNLGTHTPTGVGQGSSSNSTLKVIGGAAFAGLIGITEVVLPSSLLEIRGVNAFAGCTALASIVFDGATAAPPKMAANSGTFGAIDPNFEIWVPNAVLSAFQSAPGWSDYLDHLNGY